MESSSLLLLLDAFVHIVDRPPSLLSTVLRLSMGEGSHHREHISFSLHFLLQPPPLLLLPPLLLPPPPLPPSGRDGFLSPVHSKQVNVPALSTLLPR